ncbi:hypothetical protein KXD93_21230 [Mucilaginibacter sp. BJC16-A38]|uniref:hypothetical protein n=1 Tax=Mucilaginibacter phenanthrenivorans TaxID=1234842 RepID=UPI0021575169|nr:hypothetical protein [Mucilaginibacter phenanthrenivorans]MCR8560189.1 hypothetical protein [Mucilaginibacter phenanthrenivorans]
MTGDDLVLPCRDGYINCTEKTLQAFSYITANFTFDYIFRTNLGSFVYPEKILKFLKDKPNNCFYCGIPGLFQTDGLSIRFASGSGFFLSKDLVELIVSKRAIVDHDIIDDVAIGKFLGGENIGIDNSAIRLSYTGSGKEFQVGDQAVNIIDGEQVYHIRLRSDDRNIDIRRMQELFIHQGIDLT